MRRRVADRLGERVPESGCCSWEGSVTKGFKFGSSDSQSESGGGSEGSGGAMGDEEVRQVGGARWWRALKVRRRVL